MDEIQTHMFVDDLNHPTWDPYSTHFPFFNFSCPYVCLAGNQVSLHAPIIPLYNNFIYRPFTQGLISLIERPLMLI